MSLITLLVSLPPIPIKSGTLKLLHSLKILNIFFLSFFVSVEVSPVVPSATRKSTLDSIK